MFIESFRFGRLNGRRGSEGSVLCNVLQYVTQEATSRPEDGDGHEGNEVFQSVLLVSFGAKASTLFYYTIFMIYSQG